MSKEAKAFLDGMAAMWRWQQKGGMYNSVAGALWSDFAEDICEDATERADLEHCVVQRYPAPRTPGR